MSIPGRATRPQKSNSPGFIPSFFKLQWHITERCNFRCKHCYQESYDTPEMSLGQMEGVLDQCIALIKKWGIPRNRAFLTITGGEPFLYKDFYPFLAKVYKYSKNYSWAILSNGSLVNRENIKILKLFNIGAFQVSLEGLEKNNDKIRGEGNFKKAIEAIKLLVKEGVYAAVSFTFTKENVEDVFLLARVLAKIGVKELFVRRLVPWGKGSEMKNLLLEPLELLNFYKKIEGFSRNLYKENYQMKISFCCESPFFSKSIESEPSSPPHQWGNYCAVTRGMIMALLPDGSILPCRRLPMVIGNVLKTPLEEIYYSPQLKNLRDYNKFPENCRNCSRFKGCFGGARCITYAYFGRLDIPDPQCWHNSRISYIKNLRFKDIRGEDYRKMCEMTFEEFQSFKKILKETGNSLKNRLYNLIGRRQNVG